MRRLVVVTHRVVRQIRRRIGLPRRTHPGSFALADAPLVDVLRSLRSARVGLSTFVRSWIYRRGTELTVRPARLVVGIRSVLPLCPRGHGRTAIDAPRLIAAPVARV